LFKISKETRSIGVLKFENFHILETLFLIF